MAALHEGKSDKDKISDIIADRRLDKMERVYIFSIGRPEAEGRDCRVVSRAT